MCQHVADEHDADMVMRIGVLTIAHGLEKFIDFKKPGFHITGFTKRLDNQETEYCLSALRKKYLTRLTTYMGPEARLLFSAAQAFTLSFGVGENKTPVYHASGPPPPTQPPFNA
jgi:hypothetical protein